MPHSCPASSAWAVVGTADDDANICEAAETYNVALIAMAMTTTIIMVTMKTHRGSCFGRPRSSQGFR